MTDKREDPVYVFAAQVLSSIYHGSEKVPTPEELTHGNICFALDKLDGHLNRSHSQEETQKLLIEAQAEIADLKTLADPDICSVSISTDYSVQVLCEALKISPEEASSMATKIYNELRKLAINRLNRRKRAKP
jgi:hypothetical protein